LKDHFLKFLLLTEENICVLKKYKKAFAKLISKQERYFLGKSKHLFSSGGTL